MRKCVMICDVCGMERDKKCITRFKGIDYKGNTFVRAGVFLNYRNLKIDMCDDCSKIVKRLSLDKQKEKTNETTTEKESL